MWLLALPVLADSSHAFPLVLPRAESLQVAVAGVEAGAPVVLIPGLFGSAFAYRKVVPRLTEAGYRAIVIEPLGVGSSGRPEHADYSLRRARRDSCSARSTCGSDPSGMWRCCTGLWASAWTGSF